MLNTLLTKIKSNGFVKNSYSYLLKDGKKFFPRKDLYKLKFGKKIDYSNNEFKESGSSIREVEAFVDPNLNSVLGWLPYLKGQTSILVYHFFSTNYSLRKQTLVRLSIVKNTKLVCQKLFWFPVYSVFDFELKKYFGDVDGDSVFVEMFHPLIRKNHGEDDGHLRAWGKYYLLNGECSSTVHTLQLNNTDIFSHRFIPTRNYFPTLSDGNGFHYSRSHIEIGKNKNSKIHMGYNVFKDKDDNPRAIWHHGYSTGQLKKLDSNSKKTVQGFWCPPSKKVDPGIAIDNLETCIQGENPVEIFLVKDSVIFKKKKIIVNGFFQSNISKIFNEFVPGPYHVFVAFFCNYTDCYLHVSYDTIDNCGDIAHTLGCSVAIENDKIKPIEVKKIGNARKFLHFSKLDKDIQYYLIVYANKIEKIRDPKLNIRIYTDNNKEYLFTINPNTNEPMNIIELKKLFNGLTIDMDKCGIVQIESTDNNFAGLLMRYNSISETVAIDHLTGG
tara:strand:+ start:456 stop:1949 length:1494 start_codon:yes stop_codon:yes gene_type:complete